MDKTFSNQGTFLLIFILCAIFSEGCQKISNLRGEKRDSSTNNGPLPTPYGSPVEIPNGLNSERTYFQNRSAISLNISSELLKAGEQYSVINDSTTSTIIDQKEFSLDLSDENNSQDSQWSLLDTSTGLLKLYLLDSTVAKGFSQGENILRVTSKDTDGQPGKTAKISIYLQDFTVFGFTSLLFPEGNQRMDGLQGSFEPVTNSIVTSQDHGFMATGFLSICNQ